MVTAAKKNRSFLLTASRAVEKVAENQGMKTLRFADFRSLAYAILEAQRWEDAAGVQRLEDATDEQRLEDAEDELIVEDDV